MLPACRLCHRVVRLVARGLEACAWCWRAMGSPFSYPIGPEGRVAAYDPARQVYLAEEEIRRRMLARGGPDAYRVRKGQT
jgi:hypothetical protein